jgi:hypothetical protein
LTVGSCQKLKVCVCACCSTKDSGLFVLWGEFSTGKQPQTAWLILISVCGYYRSSRMKVLFVIVLLFKIDYSLMDQCLLRRSQQTKEVCCRTSPSKTPIVAFVALVVNLCATCSQNVGQPLQQHWSLDSNGHNVQGRRIALSMTFSNCPSGTST